MTFDRKTLVIPDKTHFEEKTIATSGDIVIGDRCLVQYGMETDGRIFIGEHAIIDGNLKAAHDVRVDIFSDLNGDIKSEGNVHLGEKVRVKGKLSLKGDLDVGDNVEIEEGFEANGWINIRSPIPMVIYIFIYLTQLLKLGHSEEIERILSQLEENDGKTIPISKSFLFIPNGSIIGIQKSRVDCNLNVGKNCKILGNYHLTGNIFIGDNTKIYGSLVCTGDVQLDKRVEVHGNIDSKGDVKIAERSHVIGDLSGNKIHLSKTAVIDGTLMAKKGVSFEHKSKKDAKEKIKRFEKNVDVADEVGEMLD